MINIITYVFLVAILFLPVVIHGHANVFLIMILSVIFFGVTMNYVAVCANGGKMPVFSDTIGNSRRHKIADAHVKLSLLCDRMPFTCKWFRIVFSIGDVYILTGFFLYHVFLLCI